MIRRSQVLLIFKRELRDQARDRRTLLMVVVLPLLMYPLLGLGILRVASMMETTPRSVILLGSEHLPPAPPLLSKDGTSFDPGLFEAPEEARRLQVTVLGVEEAKRIGSNPDEIRRSLFRHAGDAFVIVPPTVRQELESYNRAEFRIDYIGADERSELTYRRVSDVLRRWSDTIVTQRLEKENKPVGFVRPVRQKANDVSAVGEAGGSVWTKLFPFLIVLMSLTGAFYPAIDLCAGEKERGTMETLLISPASRGEIVMGKFLTVWIISIATTLLNLVGMGLTSLQLAMKGGAMGGGAGPMAGLAIAPPSLASMGWMILLLVPLSAFFSAACVALAVLAKSMKEGQYYLTPLYLVTLPLAFLTLTPEIELNLFYSLLPITGVSLLLRSLMQRDYAQAWMFFVPVLLPTMAYAAFALRWAVDQFRREDVLFREAERFDIRLWLRHLLRDKEPTPTGGEALFCFTLMLVAAWFVAQAAAPTITGMVVALVAFVLAPPLLMSLLLTSSPIRTLRLRPAPLRDFLLAAGIAVAWQPASAELGAFVEWLMPITETTKQALGAMLADAPNLLTLILALALTPAICEEVAFRGYILSGLEHGHRRRDAILLSSLLFAFLHMLISLPQQFFNATLMGLVLGMLAVRSGSLLPGIVFHFINNALAILAGTWVEGGQGTWLFRGTTTRVLYHGPIVAVSGLVFAVLVWRLVRSVGLLKPEPDRVGSVWNELDEPSLPDPASPVDLPGRRSAD